MKQIFFILLFLPVLSFAQTDTLFVKHWYNLQLKIHQIDSMANSVSRSAINCNKRTSKLKYYTKNGYGIHRVSVRYMDGHIVSKHVYKKGLDVIKLLSIDGKIFKLSSKTYVYSIDNFSRDKFIYLGDSTWNWIYSGSDFRLIKKTIVNFKY